ncbi:MAG: hypothetical protein OJF59_003057 [Cytophagales bacterium]|nr:MAG: hypothetical protein OJF59_003057 [Cytophagales bacterium]
MRLKTRSIQRFVLLSAGICAVAVILLSHVFFVNNQSTTQKQEKAKDKTEVKIQAPTEVTSQGQTGIVNDQNAVVVKEIVVDQPTNEIVVFVQKTTINFFKTLFRVFISPNAP